MSEQDLEQRFIFSVSIFGNELPLEEITALMDGFDGRSFKKGDYRNNNAQYGKHECDGWVSSAIHGVEKGELEKLLSEALRKLESKQGFLSELRTSNNLDICFNFSSIRDVQLGTEAISAHNLKQMGLLGVRLRLGV